MTDELTRAIAEATEGSNREGTAKWPECCRDTYSLAIEEIAAALAPLIVQREQRAFDRGYDKAMEGIEARANLARPGDPSARMEAYYYGFDRTGVGIIDDILSAVAHAGKAFHGTENWTEFWYGRGDYLPHGGDTPVQAIQNAANAAAEEVRRG